jgi:sigma-E factor negative regulatory protein RseC
MIEQQGQVVVISGRRAHVRIGGASHCPACDAGRGCGAGIFGRLLRRKPVTLSLDNGVGARAGQAVVVGLPESIYLKLLLRFYLLPLLAGLAGAAGGFYLSRVLGFEALAADALMLAAAIFAAVAMLAYSRMKSTEFPGGIAVHLLRLSGGHDELQCSADPSAGPLDSSDAPGSKTGA